MDVCLSPYMFFRLSRYMFFRSLQQSDSSISFIFFLFNLSLQVRIILLSSNGEVCQPHAFSSRGEVSE